MATFKANKMLNPPGANVPLLQGSPLESLLNLHEVLEELFKTAGSRKLLDFRGCNECETIKLKYYTYVRKTGEYIPPESNPY